jgi:hypothetical protein
VRITAAMLEEMDACADHVAKFRAAFPRGLNYANAKNDAKNVAKAIAAGLDIGWFAERAPLVATARRAYDEATAPARRAYSEATATAYRAHDEATATARRAYDEATATALLVALRASGGAS